MKRCLSILQEEDFSAGASWGKCGSRGSGDLCVREAAWRECPQLLTSPLALGKWFSWSLVVFHLEVDGSAYLPWWPRGLSVMSSVRCPPRTVWWMLLVGSHSSPTQVVLIRSRIILGVRTRLWACEWIIVPKLELRQDVKCPFSRAGLALSFFKK